MSVYFRAALLLSVWFLSVSSCFAQVAVDEKVQIAPKSNSENPLSRPPQLGQEVPDFELMTLDDKKVSLKKLTKEGRVVLLVLRGWPGYQCPICSRQVAEFFGQKAEFEKRGVQVVMIYPGPAELLNEHAKEFQGNKSLTAPFHFLPDPDYKFTNAWALRWDAPRETAYPSTYIIGKDNKVTFQQVSKGHGGRVSAKTVLNELDK